MILTEIVWNVKPEIFRLDWFAVRWYGLFFAAAFYFGYLIIDKFFKNENIADSVLDKLTIYMAVGTIAGARLGHCLFYQPDYYLANPFDIIKIWEGGLASHGAAVGILFSLWLFSKKTNTGYLWIVDRIVVVVALSGLFIRMGNLMNSEIYGHPTTLPWGFTFVRDVETFKNATGQAIPCHPTQIYEALAYFAIFGFLLNYYWKHKGIVKEGFMTGFFLITLFTVRFFVEFLKNNQVGFESTMILNMGQLLSIPFIIIGIYLVYKSFKTPIQE
ncbi:MAG: prolipoprotein diacylglyceryl transferase [Bacteroidota bacterium]